MPCPDAPRLLTRFDRIRPPVPGGAGWHWLTGQPGRPGHRSPGPSPAGPAVRHAHIHAGWPPRRDHRASMTVPPTAPDRLPFRVATHALPSSRPAPQAAGPGGWTRCRSSKDHATRADLGKGRPGGPGTPLHQARGHTPGIDRSGALISVLRSVLPGSGKRASGRWRRMAPVASPSVSCPRGNSAAGGVPPVSRPPAAPRQG